MTKSNPKLQLQTLKEVAVCSQYASINARLNSKPFATHLNLSFREYTDVVTALKANRNLFLADNGYIVSANTKGGNPISIIMAVDESNYGNCICIGYDGRRLVLRVTPTSFETTKGWE